jgi:tetratricopeptide (TPR) repeat protein
MFRLSLMLLVLFITSVKVCSQSDPRPNSLPPPRTNLVTVHWPDLSTLEIDVRQHLLASQESLAAAVKNQSATDAILSEAYGVMGQTYHAYSLNSPARECYVNANRLTPGNFRWFYLIAKVDQQEGRIEEAIKNYLMVRSLKPDYVAAAVSLGNIYLESNSLAEAKRNFSAALQLDKNNAAAEYGLGQVALSERNYADAVKYFERALAIVPAATRIHYSLAMSYRGLGELEKAKANLALQGTVGVRTPDPLIEELQELIKGERVHLIRGRLALEARRYAEAAAEFRKAIADKPDSVTALVNLGAVLTQLGDLSGARQQFEHVLRIAPENTNAHYNLGVLFANDNLHAEAISHLQSVLKSNPNDSGARFLLAREYLKTERQEEALAEFSRVVQADPNNEAALLERVRLLLHKKQYPEALNSLAKAHAQFPEKGQTAVTLATLLATSPVYEQRNGARALELARLIYKATGSVEHGAIISMALAELGRCAEAAEWQRGLIEIAQRKGNTEIIDSLKRDLKLYESSTCRPPAGIGGLTVH